MKIFKCNIKNLNYNEIKDKELELIKKGLKELYNIDKFELLYTENGKPYFKNIPYYLSVSHDKDLLVIILDKIEVGIDVVCLKNKVHFKKYLKIENLSDNDALIEFAKREATIKLLNLTLKDINNIDTNFYEYNIIYENEYVIVTAYYKEV